MPNGPCVAVALPEDNAELAARDVPLEPELGVRRRGGELPAPRLPPGAARPLGLGSPRAVASALLLKHEFLDGGANDVTLATLGKVLLEPTLTTLGNFLVRSNSQSSVASASFTVGGFQLEGYAMTLSAFAWNIVRTYTLTPGRVAKLHFGAFGGSIPGLVQQSAGTLDLYSMQIRASASRESRSP